MALIVIKGWWRKSPLKSSVLRVSALLLGFLLFATPYLVYLRAETGRWTISSKTEINTVMSDYPELADPGPDGGGSEPTFSRESLSVITRLIGSNLIQINRALPYLIPMPLLIFIALGLFSVGWGPDRLKWETYLISFCVLTVIGYALAVVQTRYFLVLLPIAFGWSARGILAFGGWLNQTAQELNSPKLDSFAGSGYLTASCLVGLLLCLLPLNFFITSREAAWRDRPYEERAAGTWLRHNGPTKAKVFSARKIPAFYADAVQVTPTTTDLEKVLEEIRSGGVEYVVTGKRELKRSPFLEDLEARMQAAAEFERVYSNTEHPDYNISIFRRK
jgi:hypothetical protein